MKIYLADDDRTIRSGIRSIIEKNDPDCHIVGEAWNGILAFQYIQNNDVDLLITDIKMPAMDGIELIRNIRYLNRKVKIIIVSGYDEYEFVRESLKNGAVDYILKPVDKQDLLGLIKKVKDDIETELKLQEESRTWKEKYNRSIFALKEKFLVELIKGGHDNLQLFEQQQREFSLEKSEHFYICLFAIDELYKAKNSEHANYYDFLLERLDKSIENFIGSINYNIGIIKTIQQSEVVVLFSECDMNMIEFKKATLLLINEIKSSFESTNEFTLTVGISNQYNNLKMTYKAYHQARLALNRRFFDSKDKILEYVPQKCCYSIIDIKMLDRFISGLLDSIESGNPNNVKKIISEMIEFILKENVNPEMFRETLLQVIVKINNLSQEFNDACEGFDIITDVKELDTLSEVQSQLENCFFRIAEGISLIRLERGKKIIETSVAFINKHYMDDISLKVVADYVHLNSSYFSDLFKSQTEKKFIDYLSETRINAAKKLLLKSDAKVNDIGQMVGYGDPSTFLRAFKKILGISPSEYRSVIRN